jgi:cytoskeletal protein RodZ
MTDNTMDQPNTDLNSIGIALRNKRKELSYTLEHVSEITRINLTSLRNIEEGNLDNLSGLVFVKGFIRNYAKLLGIDSNWMIEVLNNVYSPNKQGDGNFNEDVLNKETKSSGIFMAFGAVFLIACIVGFLYWNSQQNIQIADNTETIESVEETSNQPETQTIQENAAENIVQITEKISDQSDTEKVVETPINTIIHPLNLVLVSKSDDWIRLAIDNEPAKDVKLSRGEKYEWPANENYYLVMSTGDSAIIHLNGEEIEIEDAKRGYLFEMKLNKFSLTQMNN